MSFEHEEAKARWTRTYLRNPSVRTRAVIPEVVVGNLVQLDFPRFPTEPFGNDGVLAITSKGPRFPTTTSGMTALVRDEAFMKQILLLWRGHYFTHRVAVTPPQLRLCEITDDLQALPQAQIAKAGIDVTYNC